MKYQSLSDDLFEPFKMGDVKAFEHVYRLYFPSVYRYVRKHVKDEIEAKDIAADCFLKLWKYHDNILNPEHLRRYLFHSAMTGCADYYRRTGIVMTEEIEDQLSPAEDEQYLEEVKLKSQMLSIVKRYMPLLPGQYQEVLRLIYFEGLDSAGAADRLQTSVESVHTKRYRAVEALKRIIPPDALGVLLLYVILYAENQ
jgi:RNA polymerase sigma factor (sigma-70 family)